MKRGATKEEIIRTTQELITRDGIRAVRVDEIAQSLCISKRTLYEMFADKTQLVDACLEDMSRQLQQQVSVCRRRRSGSPVQKTLNLLRQYIDGLYGVDCSFLSDIRNKITYAGHYEGQQVFWQKELTQSLENCYEQELLLPDITAQMLADRFINTLFELRLKQATREELYLFSRTLLRGAATHKGIELIDKKH